MIPNCFVKHKNNYFIDFLISLIKTEQSGLFTRRKELKFIAEKKQNYKAY